MTRIFQKILRSAAALIPQNTLTRLTGEKKIHVFYHLVSNEPCPHIQHLYPVKTTRQFEQDLDELLRNYKPVSTADFVDESKPCFTLSFDDGLRQCHELIAPVLKRKGIPATFFLNTAFIDNAGLFYRYKASLLVDKTGKNDPLKITYQDKQLLDEQAHHHGVDFNSFLQSYKPYLTSSQVQSLIRDGFLIGAHSIDHPEYRYLTLEEQVFQTVTSMDDICARFHVKEKIFSFPFTDFGVGKDFFETIHKQFPESQTWGCAGLKNDSPTNHFQRIPLENANLGAGKIVKGEYLYYLLKAPFNKNRIERT